MRMHSPKLALKNTFTKASKHDFTRMHKHTCKYALRHATAHAKANTHEAVLVKTMTHGKKGFSNEATNSNSRKNTLVLFELRMCLLT